MLTIRDLSAIQQNHPTLVTVGSYDGIHLGHQYLVNKMKAAADSLGYVTAVVTFFPRPQAVLAPHLAPRVLTTPDEKAKLLERLGIDVAAILTFSPEMALLSAREFVGLLVKHLNMRQLWVGQGFALGRGRNGDIPALRVIGSDLGFDVNVVEPLERDGEVVSSTRIRAKLEKGDIRGTAALLGRNPTLRGMVVPGDKRGRRLGIPTANIALPDGILTPAKGVYACFAHLGDRRWMAVVNVGFRPTCGDNPVPTVEVHILHFDGDLYGKTLQLELIDFLRPERRFPDADSLVAQIRQDAQRAEAILTGTSGDPIS